METITHDGRTTAYRIAGDLEDGPVTLAIHGSGSTHRLWAPLYGPDGPRPFCAVDLSGHGDSEDIDTDPGDATLSAYVDDLTAVANEVGADVLVGNSLGGAVVLRALLGEAVDPAGVVLLGSGARLAVFEGLRTWLAEDFDRAIEFLHGQDRLFHDVPEQVLDRSKSQLHSTGRAVTERDFLTCHCFDVRDRLGEIETPLLAMVGEHDQLTPVAYHEYLAENVQHGRWRSIENTAHLAMLERPRAVTAAIESFCADCVQ